MKLFNEFEAVKFYEENLIFITDSSYIYYIYNPKYNSWKKYNNAGNDSITVCNYDEISKEELCDIMGVFPKKETDFMRLCHPSQLCIGDMIDLLKEDFPQYMSDNNIYGIIHKFLLESNICYKSYLKIREILDNAKMHSQNNNDVAVLIKKSTYKVLGKDIFKKEIGIVDGHDGSSYFWIMPVRVIDYSNTCESDNVAEMRSIEISIDEDDLYIYLKPFLYKYFDKNLNANKKRIEYKWVDDNGKEQISVLTDFEWNLEYNFYTMEAITNMLIDIKDTIESLSSGKNNTFTNELRKCAYIASDELIIDFYGRFVYRMEYMIRVGKENGYDLISFMGP